MAIPGRDHNHAKEGRSQRAITRIAPTAQPGGFGRGEPCNRPKMAETMIKGPTIEPPMLYPFDNDNEPVPKMVWMTRTWSWGAGRRRRASAWLPGQHIARAVVEPHLSILARGKIAPCFHGGPRPIKKRGFPCENS